MTTDEPDAATKVARLQQNLAKIETLNARLVAAMATRKPHELALDGPSQEVFLKAAAAFMAAMMQDPAKMVERQVGYWTRSLQHYVATQTAAAKGEPLPETPRIAASRTRFGTPTPPSTTSRAST